VSASGGTRAIIAALAANIGIAVAKFVGFLITGSSSMLAESAHSVADSGNQGLLLVGGRRARRRATEEARCSPSTRAGTSCPTTSR
jgi:divalent metal cation (Fe/Co/Zn/Cd) transporter